MCECVAGCFYQLPLFDGRKGSAQMPSSPCSGQVWVRNDICKNVSLGALLSVWLLCLMAFRICAEACLPGSRVDTSQYLPSLPSLLVLVTALSMHT